MGHDSLLSGQAAISWRNNRMLSWWPITGGGNASYLITAARLSLLRDCPGEDGPLLSGDLTACGVRGSSSSSTTLHPVPSQTIREGVSTAKPDSSLLPLVLTHSNSPFGKKIMDGDIEHVSYQVWVKTRPKCPRCCVHNRAGERKKNPLQYEDLWENKEELKSHDSVVCGGFCCGTISKVFKKLKPSHALFAASCCHFAARALNWE